MIVLEKNAHGWWLGAAVREEGLQRGYFPKNYVRAKNSPPIPPPRPMPALPIDEQPKASDVMENRISKRLNTNFISQKNAEASKQQTFSLKSLKAFDDLMENGISIEIEYRENEDYPDIGSMHLHSSSTALQMLLFAQSSG